MVDLVRVFEETIFHVSFSWLNSHRFEDGNTMPDASVTISFYLGRESLFIREDQIEKREREREKRLCRVSDAVSKG